MDTSRSSCNSCRTKSTEPKLHGVRVRSKVLIVAVLKRFCLDQFIRSRLDNLPVCKKSATTERVQSLVDVALEIALCRFKKVTIIAATKRSRQAQPVLGFSQQKHEADVLRSYNTAPNLTKIRLRSFQRGLTTEVCDSQEVVHVMEVYPSANYGVLPHEQQHTTQPCLDSSSFLLGCDLGGHPCDYLSGGILGLVYQIPTHPYQCFTQELTNAAAAVSSREAAVTFQKSSRDPTTITAELPLDGPLHCQQKGSDASLASVYPEFLERDDAVAMTGADPTTDNDKVDTASAATNTCRKTESYCHARSLVRPIRRTPQEAERIRREHNEILDAEQKYDYATWRMYRRITKYRDEHCNHQHRLFSRSNLASHHHHHHHLPHAQQQQYSQYLPPTMMTAMMYHAPTVQSVTARHHATIEDVNLYQEDELMFELDV